MIKYGHIYCQYNNPLVCDRLDGLIAVMNKKPDYILVDTEFVREKTYFSKLCLIQIAGPGIEPQIIDPLKPETDLQPLLEALDDPDVVKVFHSGYQDLEIFYHLTGKVPSPVFDTQVAASVLGYGDQVSYAALVKNICAVEISKSHQFTDWSLRPLSKAQTDYALGDVIHLDKIYHTLKQRLKERERESWIEEDHAWLENPATYHNHPENAWERIKISSDKPKHLGILREIAAWREEQAIKRNLPRNFIIRDEPLMEIAMTMPKDAKALARVRGFPSDHAERPMGNAMLDAVRKIAEADPATLPRREKGKPFPPSKAGILEILRMLLKIEAAQNDITPKRLADSDDLQAIAMNGQKADVPAMHDWRFEIFGSKALDLMQGKVGLSIKSGQVDISPIQKSES